MKSSIIIPNYNSEKTLQKTLESIYSEKIKDFEVILIDNFSKDDSINIIKKYPSKIIQLKKNFGASKARNTGIKKAKGEYLIFIDSDAWFTKGSLIKLIKNLEKNDIVFPSLIYENTQIFYPLLDVEKKYPHISCCFGMKKERLNKLDEAFDETYETYLEDYDFFMRCRLAGLSSKYVKDSVVVHANKTKENDNKQRYYLEIRNTIYGMIKLKRLARKAKMYNPFKLSILIKNILYGFFNYAWFNWYKNQRISFKEKTKAIFLKENTISKRPFFIKYTYKAVKENLKDFSNTRKKHSEVRKFYIKSNYL